MPPLVWREKIVLCPSCWRKVSIEDNVCPWCQTRFEEASEVRERRLYERGERMKDVGNATAIVLVALSSSLLAISIMLNNLHQWVMPIDQNLLPYIGAMAVGVIGSLIVFRSNSRMKLMQKTPTRMSRTAPYALITISFIGIVLVLFADQVDRMLAYSSWSAELIMLIAAVFGVVVLIMTSRTPSRKKKKQFA